MKRKLLYILFIVLAGSFSANLSAQREWVSPEFVFRGLPFVSSNNPCGLLWADSLNVSQVTLHSSKNNGGLVNYHQSDNDYSYGAHAGSVFHFSSRIVLRGSLDYSYYEGKHMSGSMFINPYANAFDIMEFDDKNRGNKKLEQYNIQAELGYNVYRNLILGASFRLVSANYSKMKDLRHSNTYSNLQLGGGVAYRFGRQLSAGLSYRYTKSIEDILFKRYSKSEKHYDLLVSPGGFWGKRKTYEEPIGILSPKANPVVNKYHTAALQLQYSPSHRLNFFFEGQYADRHGSYGIKSPTSIEYLYHEGTDYSLALTALVQFSARVRHVFTLDYAHSSHDNYENVYKETVSDDYATEVNYYDALSMGNNSVSVLGLHYRADFSIQQHLPLWTVQLDAHVNQFNRQAVSYPYFRQDKFSFLDLSFQSERNFPKGNHLFSVSLGVGYQDGLDDTLNDGSYINDPTQIKPRTSEQMHGREREYFTTSQLSMSPSFQYSHRFRWLTAYAETAYTYAKSLSDVNFLTSDYRHSLSVSAGLIF